MNGPVVFVVVGLVCVVWWVAAAGVAWLKREQAERRVAREQWVRVRDQQEREWRRVRAGYERALREISTLENQTRQRLTEPVVPTRRYDPNCRKCQQERAAWQAQRSWRWEIGQ